MLCQVNQSKLIFGQQMGCNKLELNQPVEINVMSDKLIKINLLWINDERFMRLGRELALM